VDLSIVVVSYNVRELLKQCLQSVITWMSAPGRPRCELFVVDNASSDDSAALVEAEFPAARLIVSPENRGFAAANNLALRQASGRYRLLLNPDTVVLDDALGLLLRFLDDHPRAGAVAPQLYYPDGRFQHNAFHFPTLGQTFFEFFTINWRLRQSWLNGRYPVRRTPFQMDHPLGACLMVRQETLDQVGLLDEAFFMYCEEIDWCWRIKKAGWQIWSQPAARVVHYAGQSTRQFHQAMTVALWRSRFLLYDRYYPAWWRFLNRQIIGIGVRREIARTEAAFARGEITPRDREARLAAYREVMALVKGQGHKETKEQRG